MILEFQKDAINKLTSFLSDSHAACLIGLKGSGKTTILKEIEEQSQTHMYNQLFFTSSASEQYQDYAGIPEDFLKEFKKKYNRKNLFLAAVADIAEGISGSVLPIPITFSRVMDSLLTREDRYEAEIIYEFIVKSYENKKILIIFDHINFFGKIAYAIMLKFLENIKENNNISIIFCIEGTDISKSILADSFVGNLPIVSLAQPTENDLKKLNCNFLDGASNLLSLQKVLELEGKLPEDRFNSLIHLNEDHFKMNKSLLFSSLIINRPAKLDELHLFLPYDQDLEIIDHLSELVDTGLMEKTTFYGEDFFEIKELYHDTLENIMPAFLSRNRKTIFSSYLEKSAPFSYFEKFVLYKSMNHTEKAHVNGFLFYCMCSRSQKKATVDEMDELLKYFKNGKKQYQLVFQLIINAYSLFNSENYVVCFDTIEIFLKDYDLLDNKMLKSNMSVFPWEFIGEIYYLRALCIGRIEKNQSDLSQVMVESIKSIKEKLINTNRELSIRLDEGELVILTRLKENGENNSDMISNSYFGIYRDYTNELFSNNYSVYNYWRFRYAFHLSKINIVDNILNKLDYIEESYQIIKEYKDDYTKIFIRISNNVAADLIWRDKIEDSLHILEKAIECILKLPFKEHWGNIFHNYYIFSLYNNTINPKQILKEYKDTLLSNKSMSQGLHEKKICKSNYSILLASNGCIPAAIKELESEPIQSLNEYEYYLYMTNLGALYYLENNCEKALDFENKCAEMIKNKKVPYFDQIFLEKRNILLKNLYLKNGEKVSDVLLSLEPDQELSTGYHYTPYSKLMLFSDINYWAN